MAQAMTDRVLTEAIGPSEGMALRIKQAVLVVAGIVSMFRRPLAYFARRLMTRMREGAS